MFSAYTRGAKPLLRALRTAPTWPGHRRCFSLHEKQHDPLRILFCGADEFSIHSLQALHDLKDEKPNTIASIDVVCRPDKRTGRGLKYIHQVPVKPVAESLGLPIHQIDTFKGWNPPSPIDLVVAVSFGLLVPARVLSAARYGGLNVHPSLLPDLRGPSPLQYALMLGRKQTGVSIQTMHPTKFDHGAILAQESISIPDDWTLEQLSETAGRLGASLLRTAVEKAMFMNPVNFNSTEQRVRSELVHAPKITKEDAHVDWRNWTSDKVIRYGRVLELWDETTYPICFPGKSARVKYQGPWVSVGQAEAHLCTFNGDSAAPPGHPVALSMDDSKKWRLAFHTSDGCLVSPSSASIEGKKEGGGVQALTQVLHSLESDAGRRPQCFPYIDDRLQALEKQNTTNPSKSARSYKNCSSDHQKLESHPSRCTVKLYAQLRALEVLCSIDHMHYGREISTNSISTHMQVNLSQGLFRTDHTMATLIKVGQSRCFFSTTSTSYMDAQSAATMPELAVAGQPSALALDELSKYRELCDSIKTQFRPQIQTTHKPTLSLERLAFIAVYLNMNGNCATALEWLIWVSPYYRYLVAAQFSEPRGPRAIEAEDFRRDFYAAICSLDVPISIHAKPRSDLAQARCTTTTTQARIFLDLNTTDKAKPFRFMDLPPELRNTIYEMAISMPKSGINIKRSRSLRPYITAISKDSTASIEPRRWFFAPLEPALRDTGRVKGRELSQYLDILRTSKQFYKECMPLFYSCNHFVFLDNSELNTFMSGTPEHRRNHIQHTSIFLNPKDISPYTTCRANGGGNLTKDYSGLQALQSITDLKTLNTVMWEDEWTSVRKTTGQGAQKYTEILKVPPMKVLEQFRGLETVTFLGDCDTVKTHLEPLMTRPKLKEVERHGGGQAGTSGKKRKAKEQAESGRMKKVRKNV